MPVTLLGLNLRRMVACNLSTFHAQRQVQLERMAALPCGLSAVLVDADVPDAAAGSGVAVIRVDQLRLEAEARRGRKQARKKRASSPARNRASTQARTAPDELRGRNLWRDLWQNLWRDLWLNI